ncbi:TIGR02266 family protein [Thermodesulfobacteriota bacterium]
MFTLVSEETFEKGQVIFKEGSSGDWVYHIISGSVEVSRNVGGKKFVLEILKEGEVFGELGFIGKIKRSATVTAVEETVVGIIDRDTMDQEFNKLSSDFRSILVSVAVRFEKMIERVSTFSARCEPRVMKTLKVSYKEKLNFLKVYTDNISGGGLFIRTGKPLPKDEEIILKLQLPDFPQPLTVKCKVAWIKKEGEGQKAQPPGMGLKFLEMSKKDEVLFQNFIKEFTGK